MRKGLQALQTVPAFFCRFADFAFLELKFADADCANSQEFAGFKNPAVLDPQHQLQEKQNKLIMRKSLRTFRIPQSFAESAG